MSNLDGNDERIPQGRLIFFTYVTVVITVLLLIGFWKLQVIQSGHYSELAERNQIRSIPIIAPRGRMLDREGRVIVDNYPSFSILLLRDNPSVLQKSLQQVAEGLGIPLDDLNEQMESAKYEPKFQPIVIKPEATQGDIAFVESHRADLPVLELLMVHRRRYPHNFLSSAIGYVGEVTPKQLDQSEGKYRPGDIVGKAGLEREYNETLVGVDGMRRVIVNSVGKPMETLKDLDATPGKPIQLTIDDDLQAIAEAGMAGKQGAVVAMEAQTGEILALVSNPTADPNDFAVRISPKEWQQLNEDPDKPLLNRAIQAQLAPGSVFKIVMATAMLESKAIPEDFSVFCPGYADFYGRVFHCWEKKGHGRVSLHAAIVHSCDVFFYNVGKRLGIDRISYYATSLGLGRRTGIDLPGEEGGLIPSEEWKKRVYHQDWYPGETISVSIGQGAVIVTPVQLARTIVGIANGGNFVQPHLMKDFPNPHVDHFAISEDTVEQVTQGMFGVVNEAGGTAGQARLPGIEICGKTGTAQVISAQGLTRVSGGNRAEFRNNAWFVGYAPRRNPEIVISILVQESAQHGGAFAPIVRDMVKAYYDKKNHRFQQQTTAANSGGTGALKPVATAVAPQSPAQAASTGSHQR